MYLFTKIIPCFILVCPTTNASGQDFAFPTYEVYAIRYTTIPAFPVGALIVDADSSRRADIAMMVWLIRDGKGRNILVDAGFHREKYIKSWKPQDFVLPSEAVRKFGVAPEQVTDIIISHMHWDHAGGIDLFPKARVWVQREEYNYYTTGEGNKGNNGVDRDDDTLFIKLNEQKRLMLVDGDAKEILPKVTVYTGGRHTFASQYVGVETKPGSRIILASDNMYLYENLDRHVPISQTFDAASNLKAQDRMRQLASELRFIIPGHDADVFRRFPKPGNGVAKIE
jgi:glyoxylase-like metal-dependent hydrolase (beta-lactamase superfamily II)